MPLYLPLWLHVSRHGVAVGLNSGRMVVTLAVERIQPPLVTVSGLTPKLAAELASLSGLLPPMKRAVFSLAVC